AGDYINLPPFEPGSLQAQHTPGAPHLAPPRPDNRRTTTPTHPEEPARPDIHKLLANKDHTWSGIVRDYDDCQELIRQYMSLNDKTGDTDVAGSNDFPEDKKAQKELARQLFEAILEVDPAASEHIHYKPIRELSNLEVELLSWELLFATRRAQDGIVGWAKWLLKPGQRYQKCKNFQERFVLVKEGCRHAVGSFYNPDNSSSGLRLVTGYRTIVPLAHQWSSASQDSHAPNLAGELLENPGRPLAPSAHQMSIMGAADVGYPVAQPHPDALVYLPAAFPQPPLAWEPTETFMSQVFEEVLSNPESFEPGDEWLNFEMDA
ncbi:hypothetical protein F5144DRAFT_488774, partial [Chaetomium tenue]